MKESPEAPWNQLARAARAAPTETEDATPPAPPRVAEIRLRVMAVVRAILWRRLSLVIAVLALIAWALLKFATPEPTLPPLTPMPSELLETR
jgi:hypothetical protein